MALSFPLSAAAFADLLGVRDVALNLDTMLEFSGVASGDLQSANVAPARWMAEVELAPLTHAAAAQRMALIHSLAARGASFLLYHSSLYYPQDDLDGSALGAATPDVDSRDSSWTLSIKNLPTSPYTITVGDWLSIAYDSGTRLYLGQFAETDTGDGTGDIAAISVVPALPAAVASDDAITIVKACGKFRIEPGSAHVSTSGPKFQTIKFSAVQTYEAN